MKEPLLKDRSPDVDPERIGISYSGGGNLVVVELACARAFVKRGILPSAIAGVSAGALTAFGHALDVRGGAGIAMGLEMLSTVSTRTLGLGHDQILERLALERQHVRALGDHRPIEALIRAAVEEHFGLRGVTLGMLAPPRYPKLMVAATDWLSGTPHWFGEQTPIETALMASAAIPGLFPWHEMVVDGRPLVLVDGAVISNQPLSRLALDGCGTIFACAFSGAAHPEPGPRNALHNLQRCMHIMVEHASRLEEDYVRLKLGDRGTVHHIDIQADLAVHGYDFTPQLIEVIAEEYSEKVAGRLRELGY